MTIDHDSFPKIRELVGFSLGKWFALVKPLSSILLASGHGHQSW